MKTSALAPNMDLLLDALRPCTASTTVPRMWYRDQHLQGGWRGAEVRDRFRAELIRARGLPGGGEGRLPRAISPA